MIFRAHTHSLPHLCNSLTIRIPIMQSTNNDSDEKMRSEEDTSVAAGAGASTPAQASVAATTNESSSNHPATSPPPSSSSSSSAASTLTQPTSSSSPPAAVVASSSPPAPSPSATPTPVAAYASHAAVLDCSLHASLDSLLFGDTRNCAANDVDRWRRQGFVFSPHGRTQFGLTQVSGGPCGVLAPVQAFVLRHMLFGGVAAERISVHGEPPVAPTKEEQEAALVWAVTHIIERARVDIPSSSSASGNQDGYVVVLGTSHDALLCYRLPSIAAVHDLYTQSLPFLHSKLGVLCFVYSVLLSRGLDRIRSDMDDATSFLVGAFGHSSQELVNLLLVGRARTNTFDGVRVLGDRNDPTAFKLKGIEERNEIGFLTLLEALRYTSVGEYYKSPHYPIWVVGSSNHFTVLFSLDRRVGGVTAAQVKSRIVRSAFDELDPEQNHFIPTDQLPALLLKLAPALKDTMPPNMSIDAIRSRLDPQGLGIILYDRVLTVMESWKKEKQHAAEMAARAAAAASATTSSNVSNANTTPFDCTACTFHNEAGRSMCEICGTPRPPPQPQPQPAPSAASSSSSSSSRSDEDEEIQNFTLYFYNGLEIEGKTQCTLVRIGVSVVEGGLPPQVQGEAMGEGQGLKEILLTRWPSCILEMEGEAKIS